MKVKIKDRIDLYTDDGLYIYSICKGGDGKWRNVYLYVNGEGKEAIMSIKMISPDYTNMAHMNI